MTEVPDRKHETTVMHPRDDVNEVEPWSTGTVRDGRITSLLLLLGAIGTVACSILGRFALGLSEDSGAESFRAYRQHPFPIFLTYGVGMLAGILLILAAPLLYQIFACRSSSSLRVAATCQALAGMTLALSASRWLIVLPFLQKQYDDSHASEATRAAINVDYDTISYFLGITLGEHLFAILIGVATLIWATHVSRSSNNRRRIGRVGIVGGAGWLLGSIEQLDFSLAQYFIGFLAAGPIIWLIWTALLGRELTRGRGDIVAAQATK